jgi:hypothetical protein
LPSASAGTISPRAWAARSNLTPTRSGRCGVRLTAALSASAPMCSSSADLATIVARVTASRLATVGSFGSGAVMLATSGFGLVRRLISAEAASNTCCRAASQSSCRAAAASSESSSFVVACSSCPLGRPLPALCTLVGQVERRGTVEHVAVSERKRPVGCGGRLGLDRAEVGWAGVGLSRLRVLRLAPAVRHVPPVRPAPGPRERAPAPRPPVSRPWALTTPRATTPNRPELPGVPPARSLGQRGQRGRAAFAGETAAARSRGLGGLGQLRGCHQSGDRLRH